MSADPQALWANLPAAHRNVMRMLGVWHTADKIAEKLGVPTERALVFLYRLRMDGLVREEPIDRALPFDGSMWKRTPLGDAANVPGLVQIPHYGRINVEHDHEIVTGAAE